MRTKQHAQTGFTRPFSSLLLAFSMLCLLTSFMLNHMGHKQVFQQQVSPHDTKLGPIHVSQNNTVLKLEAQQNLPTNSWSFLTFTLLDANQQYLTAFGDELWDETGRDSDGPWHQADNNFSGKVTIAEAGDYYLSLEPESSLSNTQQEYYQVWVSVTTEPWSPVPHFAAGIITLVLGAFLNLFSGGFLWQLLKEDSKKIELGKLMRSAISRQNKKQTLNPHRTRLTASATVLTLLYIMLFHFASNGYGYPGYHGHYARPSFWYFGSPHYYPNQNLRRTSLAGPGSHGGGLHYGK